MASLLCVHMRSRPINPAMHHRRLRNPHQLQSPRQQSSERSPLGLGSAELTQQGIRTTRGHPRGSCPIMGSPRRSTGHRACVPIGQARPRWGERHRNERENALCKHGIGNFVEFETGKGAAGLEHAVRLAEDIRDRGNVPDTKCNGVEIVGVVGERLLGQSLGVCFNEPDLRCCRGKT
jgi:hypothetical protein